MVTENADPAVAEAGADTSSVVAGPGANVTAAEALKAAAFRVAVTVATPVTVELVRVAS